jgi:hypothetical protein
LRALLVVSEGRIDLAQDYLADLAQLVGGTVKKTAKVSSWYVVGQSAVPPRARDVLRRSGEWLELIDKYTGRLREAIESRA